MNVATIKGYVYVQESVWVVNEKTGKKTSTKRTVKKLGKLEVLTANNPNALEELKAKYKRKTAADIAKETLEEMVKEQDNPPPASTVIRPSMLYANYMVRSIWQDVLGLGEYFRNRARFADMSLADIFFYCVCCKLVHPASNLMNFERQINWIGAPAGYVNTVQQFYRALDFIHENRTPIMQQVHRGLSESMGRDVSLLFYDVTNAWFETPYDDLEHFEMKFAKFVKELEKQRRKEYQEKKQPEPVPLISDKELEELREKKLDEESLIRFRGPSKERRTDMPIISIALVVDRNGIPVDYRTYPGNASEKVTMKDSIKALAADYDIKGATVVADRGLNTKNNLWELDHEGHGFIVAQSVLMLSKELQKRIVSNEGWVLRRSLAPGESLDKVQREDKHFLLIPQERTDPETGAVMRPTIVVTFSQERRERDLHLIAEKEKKAREAVANGTNLQSKTNWRSYVKAENSKAARINEKRLQEHKDLAGYYAYIYNNPAKADKPMEPTEVITEYRSLEHIEECFRVMKDSLDLRPFYSRTDPRLDALVQICVVALIVLRIMMEKLKAVGLDWSEERVIRALQNAKVGVEKIGDRVCFAPSGMADTLMSDAVKQPNGKRGKIDFKNLELNACEETDTILLMKVLGLTPLPGTVTHHELATCLKTRFKTPEDALGFKLSFVPPPQASGKL